MKRTAMPFSMGPTPPSRPEWPEADHPAAQGELRAGHAGRRLKVFLRERRWLLAGWLAAMLCLLWPALVNSQPLFFYDTIGYLRGAVQAFHVAGLESGWPAYVNPGAAPEVPAETVAERAQTDGFISSARSIYYGALLYAGDVLGSFWFTLLLQALAAGLAIHLTLRALGMGRAETPLVLGALGILTPLSFYSSYLMPDVFAGVTILAGAGLLVFFDRLGWRERALYFTLLSVSLMFHASHIAVAVLLGAAGVVIVRLATKRTPWKGAGAVSAAVAIGLLSQAAFYWTVEAVYGHSPLRPPFLMARVIDDGPGYDYLKATCPENGFKVCEFLPVLPLGTDAFLWSKDPESGVIGPADPETRRRLADEQMAFVVEVLRHDFTGQLAASMKGFVQQLSRFAVTEFRYSDPLRELVAENLPPRERTAFRNSLLYRDGFPLAGVSVFHALVIGSSAAFLIWGLFRLSSRRPAVSGVSEKTARTLTIFCLAVLAGVVANAAVTGILSIPHDRYQARIIWLIPLLALSVFLCLRKELRAVPDFARKVQA
ncbi:MAG: hypothetical protein ACLFWF_10360 [Alphaproteobacteria bacterium]